MFSARAYYSLATSELENLMTKCQERTIGEFNMTGTETWARYIDSLGQYSEANQITDGGRKLRAILKSVVGPTTYELFCKLLAPRSLLLKRSRKRWKSMYKLYHFIFLYFMKNIKNTYHPVIGVFLL